MNPQSAEDQTVKSLPRTQGEEHLAGEEPVYLSEPPCRANRYNREPTQRELLFLILLSAAVMWTTLFALHKSKQEILESGDNFSYLQVAQCILHWDFRHMVLQQFMGYSYFIAGLSLLHLPPILSLWLIAFGSSLLSAWLAARLLGTWVAAYFVLTNFAWFQLSFLGGSEPLCVALSLGAMLAFRKKLIFLAALLASLAVTVRPLMICTLWALEWYCFTGSRSYRSLLRSQRD